MKKILILILIVSSNIWSQSNLSSDRPTFSDDPYLIPKLGVQLELGANPSEKYIFGSIRLKISPKLELRASLQREDLFNVESKKYLSVAVRSKITNSSSFILDTDFLSNLDSKINTVTMKYLKDLTLSTSGFNLTYNIGTSLYYNDLLDSTSITGVYSGCLGYAIIPSRLTLLLELYNPDIRRFDNHGVITAILINPMPNLQLDLSGDFGFSETRILKSGIQVGLTLLL